MLKPYKIRDLKFKKGTISTVTTTPANNGMDYLTVLKYALQLINVSYSDPCCPDEPNNAAPVRFSIDDSELQYFNGTEWVAAP